MAFTAPSKSAMSVALLVVAALVAAVAGFGFFPVILTVALAASAAMICAFFVLSISRGVT